MMKMSAKIIPLLLFVVLISAFCFLGVGALESLEAEQAEFVGTLINNIGTNHELVKANTVMETYEDGSQRIRIDPTHLDTEQVIVRFDHDEGNLLREAIRLGLPVLRSGNTWYDPNSIVEDKDYKYIYAQLSEQINGNVFTLDLDTILNEQFTAEQLNALYIQSKDANNGHHQLGAPASLPALKQIATKPMLVETVIAAFSREMRDKEQREAERQLLTRKHEFLNNQQQQSVGCPLSALKGVKVWNRLLDPKIRIQQLPGKVLPPDVKLTFEYGKERGVGLQSLIEQLQKHGYEEVYIPCKQSEWKAHSAKAVQQVQQQQLQLNHRGARVFAGMNHARGGVVRGWN